MQLQLRGEAAATIRGETHLKAAYLLGLSRIADVVKQQVWAVEAGDTDRPQADRVARERQLAGHRLVAPAIA